MTGTGAARPRVGFVLEATLGHITHAANLRDLIPATGRVTPAFAAVEYPVSGRAARLPGYGNWTVRAGLRARTAIRRLKDEGALDALFIHTQVPAILSPDHLGRIPSVVSLDATPIQYDALGAHYGHAVGTGRAERLKLAANRLCFRRANRIVAWSHWTKAGLVERYDVPPDKVVVIPPGVNTASFTPRAGAAADHDEMRVLFVGGDFERKGGSVLVAAVVALRAEGANVSVDVVTRDEVAPADGVRVHHGLGPNSPGLIDLYQWADVFCLPTLGDCLPMVLSEAGAIGLPLVSTDVGAIREIVRDGETGLLTPVGDAGALAGALGRLADDPSLRRRLGARAQVVVGDEFDAAKNAGRLADLLVDVAGA